MPDETFVLNVTRQTGSSSATCETFPISGDANFIWEQFGILICDQLVRRLTVERPPVIIEPVQQITE